MEKTLECLQLGISLTAFGLSLLVLRGAWSDWQDAKAAGEGITAQANEIARERLIGLAPAGLVTEALAALDVETLVLDGEVIALAEGGRPQPFQVTGARTASTADVERLQQA